MKTNSALIQPRVGVPVLSLVLAVGFAGATYAGQVDALNSGMDTISVERRAAEGRHIDAYPAVQENAFGAESDTVYDHPYGEGWGETGWQGGG